MAIRPVYTRDPREPRSYLASCRLRPLIKLSNENVHGLQGPTFSIPDDDEQFQVERLMLNLRSLREVDAKGSAARCRQRKSSRSTPSEQLKVPKAEQVLAGLACGAKPVRGGVSVLNNPAIKLETIFRPPCSGLPGLPLSNWRPFSGLPCGASTSTPALVWAEINRNFWRGCVPGGIGCQSNSEVPNTQSTLCVTGVMKQQDIYRVEQNRSARSRCQIANSVLLDDCDILSNGIFLYALI